MTIVIVINGLFSVSVNPAGLVTQTCEKLLILTENAVGWNNSRNEVLGFPSGVKKLFLPCLRC